MAPRPQRLTIVLPSTGAFDSRTWRIARSLSGRGHAITVVARGGDGLPEREDVDGIRFIRVPVAAIDGLPGPIRALVRLVRRPRTASAGAGATATARLGTADTSEAPATGGLLGRGIGAVIRLARIGLTIRAQRLATMREAPQGDLVHAMAYMGIPIGLALGRRDGAPVVYDARDIYVEARNIARLPGPARRLFATIERRWAQGASRVMTVNRAYAEEMARRFETALPAIVLNCSPRPAAAEDGGEPRPARRFHAALGLAESETVVLYHGGLSPERGIEQLIAALPLLPDTAHLVLMGYGPLADRLIERTTDPALGGRLHVLPAVPPAELLSWVGAADVAAMPIQPTTLNHRLTTPNKLFEAMTAGVPVVAPDLPGMASIVTETGCGVVCDPTDPAAVAAAIRTILDAPDAERAGWRSRALAAARTTYHWEAQVEILLDEYGRLTGEPW